MATKSKGRIAPDIEEEMLLDNFAEQLLTGVVRDATANAVALPSFAGAREQAARIHRCILRAVTVVDRRARRSALHDVRIESSDLANIDLTEGLLERVELLSTRLTGAICTEARLKSVLFRECKLDFAVLRMARLQQCVFERCNLTDADFYGADLSGTVFRDCDFGRADVSNAKLTGADIRGCRLDGLRGTPAAMEGLVISADQAALLITLFGVKVAW